VESNSALIANAVTLLAGLLPHGLDDWAPFAGFECHLHIQSELGNAQRSAVSTSCSYDPSPLVIDWGPAIDLTLRPLRKSVRAA
jgi:hypothetical protein